MKTRKRLGNNREPATRIAINGRYLDDIHVPLPRSGNTASYLTFPAHRHWARLASTCLRIGVQPLTLVQLYFDGTVPVGRDVPVTVQIGETAPALYLITRIEANERHGDDDVAVLHLRHAPIDVGP